MIGALLGLRVGVHQRGGQARQRVQQVMLRVDRDPVGLDRAGPGVHDDLAFGAQMVPDPPQPDLAAAQHPGVMRRDCCTRSSRAGSTASISRR